MHRGAAGLAVAWLDILPGLPPSGGAARCDGGPAASPLPALMCKCHRAAAGLAKGLPQALLASRLGASSSQWRFPRGRRSDFDHHRPAAANISMLVKHIEAVAAGRALAATACAKRSSQPFAASTASAMARGTSSASPLRCGQQSPASRCRSTRRIKSWCQLATCKTLALTSGSLLRSSPSKRIVVLENAVTQREPLHPRAARRSI